MYTTPCKEGFTKYWSIQCISVCLPACVCECALLVPFRNNPLARFSQNRWRWRFLPVRTETRSEAHFSYLLCSSSSFAVEDTPSLRRPRPYVLLLCRCECDQRKSSRVVVRSHWTMRWALVLPILLWRFASTGALWLPFLPPFHSIPLFLLSCAVGLANEGAVYVVLSRLAPGKRRQSIWNPLRHLRCPTRPRQQDTAVIPVINSHTNLQEPWTGKTTTKKTTTEKTIKDYSSGLK